MFASSYLLIGRRLKACVLLKEFGRLVELWEFDLLNNWALSIHVVRVNNVHSSVKIIKLAIASIN